MATKTHEQAVRSLMRARNALVERVEAALSADDLPPLSWYELLAALDEGPAEGLRPRDLGYAVALTRSGLTRLLDRIHAAGLVERRECPEDRRGHLVALTDAGHRTLRLMRPVQERAVAEGFAALVADDEARTIAEVLDRVTAGACEVVGDGPAA